VPGLVGPLGRSVPRSVRRCPTDDRTNVGGYPIHLAREPDQRQAPRPVCQGRTAAGQRGGFLSWCPGCPGGFLLRLRYSLIHIPLSCPFFPYSKFKSSRTSRTDSCPLLAGTSGHAVSQTVTGSPVLDVSWLSGQGRRTGTSTRHPGGARARTLSGWHALAHGSAWSAGTIQDSPDTPASGQSGRSSHHSCCPIPTLCIRCAVGETADGA